MLKPFLTAAALLSVVLLLMVVVTEGNGWTHIAVRAAALAVLVTGGYLRWRKAYAAHRSRTHCLGCGYPRRGLPAEAVCPECGLKQGERSAPR